ncbi:cyclin-D4-2-like isoform X2 [Carica papaya]|uniref:cyclin-D4-2-like isoform X2 n=1 Tax=Carica papaya TaxID=3649 RepID=UPI000B8C8359|nr:cyclin-D4-2-like isoform X2 [Carica papaya]
MAPSFDSAVSSLICTEDNSIFDDNENYGSVVGGFDDRRSYRTLYHYRGSDCDVGLPLQSEECLAMMIEKETQHLPASDYLKKLRNGDFDLNARKEAVDWIGKKGIVWMMQLLAVACLSLAAKMEETEVPVSLDLQVGESKFVFEATTIQRMELLVLGTLNWRMQAVTPFSFLDYFLHKINGDQPQLNATTMSRSIQLISSSIKGIDLLEFRPSEIAAAVAISALLENQTLDLESAISHLAPYIVQKERMLKCMELMKDGSGCIKAGIGSVSSVPQSPIGVLDAACLSCDSTLGSCANSSQTTPPTKRRKLNNRPCQVER